MKWLCRRDAPTASNKHHHNSCLFAAAGDVIDAAVEALDGQHVQQRPGPVGSSIYMLLVAIPTTPSVINATTRRMRRVIPGLEGTTSLGSMDVDYLSAWLDLQQHAHGILSSRADISTTNCSPCAHKWPSSCKGSMATQQQAADIITGQQQHHEAQQPFAFLPSSRSPVCDAVVASTKEKPSNSSSSSTSSKRQHWRKVPYQRPLVLVFSSAAAAAAAAAAATNDRIASEHSFGAPGNQSNGSLLWTDRAPWNTRQELRMAANHWCPSLL